MQLFYAPVVNSPLHTLSEDESRHAVKVLRLGEGDLVELVDGRGGMHTARIERADPRKCVLRFEGLSLEYGKRPYRLVMAVAPTKNLDRFEWFLEKATEVGVDSIVPILCDNSERRVFRPDRAEKILISAMKQSARAYLPSLEPLTPVREVLERPFEGVKLIALCRPLIDEFHDEMSSTMDPTRVPVTEALPPHTDALVLIGPEGDFTRQEAVSALQNGFTPISLGDSRLRTETAALTVVIAAALKNS
jgi:16S rRNA (uracil1498-N3)-methyltransferase